MYRKNTAGQFICVQLLLTATGAVATGLSPAARRCIDGTFATGGGTFTEDGTTGSYKYALAQADTNGNDISIIVTATGAIPVVINFVTTAADPTDAVRLGLTALPNATVSGVGGLLTAPTTANVGLADLSRILGTALTETAGLLAGGFKKFFNVVAPTMTALSINQTGDAYAEAVLVKTDLDSNLPANFVNMIIDANGRVDIGLIQGSTNAASNVSKTNEAIVRGTCSGGSTTTAICSSITTPSTLTDTGQLIGRTIIFDSNTTTAALRGQASAITNSTTGATPTLTYTAMTHSPANGDTFSVV